MNERNMIKNDIMSHVSGILTIVGIVFGVIIFLGTYITSPQKGEGMSWGIMLALPFFIFSIIPFIVFVLRGIYLAGREKGKNTSTD